jgi:hypothetical protein
VVSILAVILGFIGCLVDGLNTRLIKTMKACASGPIPSSENPILYGNSAFETAAAQCYEAATQYHDCFCVNTNMQPTITHQNPNACYIYDGQPNCKHILVNYPQMLTAATAFDVIMLLSVFALSVTTCCSLCCPKYLPRDASPTSRAFPSRPTVVNATPAQDITQPARGGNATFTKIEQGEHQMPSAEYQVEDMQPVEVTSQPDDGGHDTNGTPMQEKSCHSEVGCILF